MEKKDNKSHVTYQSNALCKPVYSIPKCPHPRNGKVDQTTENTYAPSKLNIMFLLVTNLSAFQNNRLFLQKKKLL